MHITHTVSSVGFAISLLMFIFSISAVKFPFCSTRQFLLCRPPVTNLLRKLKSPLCHDDLMNPPLFVQGQNGHGQSIPAQCVNATSPQKDKTQKGFPRLVR